MVAIVSGNGLGLNQGSLPLFGNAGQVGGSTQGRSGEQAFVDVSTGNLVLQDLDAILMGLGGSDIASLRTYNSQGLNSHGWQWGEYKSVTPLGANLQRTDADGSTSVYAWDAARQLYVQAGSTGTALDTLALEADGSCTWTDGATGATEHYAGAQGSTPGLILSATDTEGHTRSFSYDGTRLATVTDENGESVHYGYTAGQLTSISTQLAGGQTLHQVSYTYDGAGRLKTVAVDLDPQGNLPAGSETAAAYLTTYDYDGSSDRVAGITQSDGTHVGFSYTLVDGSYKVHTVTDGLGQVTTFGYDSASNTTTVVDPLGVATVLQYDAAGRLLSTRQGVTAQRPEGLASQGYTYTALGEVQSITDALGHVTQMTYDARGNLLTQVDATGAGLQRTYNERNQVLTQTVTGGAAGLVTRQVHADGNATRLRFSISAEGGVTEYRYNAQGLLASTRVYAGAIFDLTALGATDVPGEAALADWAAQQNPARVQLTELGYDLRGQLQTSTTYGELDAAGAGTAASAHVTHFVYDARGLLLQTVNPDGDTTQSVYDGLGRQVFANATAASGTPALTQSTYTQYDDANGRTTLKLANGLNTVSSYDATGRLVSVSQNAAGQSLGGSSYTYDADGRLTMTTDATGAHSWMLYDDAGRKIADVGAMGTLLEYRYDAAGHVVQTIAYVRPVDISTLSTTGGVQPALDSLRVVDPDGKDATTWSFHDGAGRLRFQVDARGAVTETRYDAASRVITTVQYEHPLDLSGGVTAQDAIPAGLRGGPNDREINYVYDRDGLLKAAVDAEGYVTEYRHDAAGRLTETIRRYAQSGAFISWMGALSLASALADARANDTLDSLAITDHARDLHSFTLYDSRGRIAVQVDNEGYLTQTTYDGEGRVTTVRRYADPLPGVTAGTTLADLDLVTLSSTADQVTTNTWDGLGRLSTQTDASGTVTRYTYDAVGQLVKTEQALGTADLRTLNVRYDVQGRVVAELSAEGANHLTPGLDQAGIEHVWDLYGTRYTYDAAGRRTSSTALDDKGHTLLTVYAYDTAGRLRFTIDPAGTFTEQRYDALGHTTKTIVHNQNVSPSVAASLVGYVVDAATPEAALPAGSQVTSREYDASGNLVSVRGDQTVTTMSYDAFGEVVSTMQGSGPEAETSTRAYDRRGELSETLQDDVEGGLRSSMDYRYDAFGRLVLTVDPRGNLRQWAYDSHGRVITTTDGKFASSLTSYDAFGRVHSTTDARGHTTTYAYDDQARTSTVTTPEGVQVKTFSDRLGRTVRVIDGAQNVTDYTYDDDGHLTSTTTSAGTAENDYDNLGRLAESRDAEGNVVAYDYDAVGRVFKRTIDPLGLNLVTEYHYDTLGQLQSQTDASGVATSFAYDLDGRLTRRVVDPSDSDHSGLNLETTYEFDSLSHTVAVTEPGGLRTEYRYDHLGQRTRTIVDPLGERPQETRYTYDAAGNVRTVIDANNAATEFLYDENNRQVWSINSSGYVATRAYDANGNLIESTRYADNLWSVGGWDGYSPMVPLSRRSDEKIRTVYDDDNRAVYTLEKTDDDAHGAIVQRTFDGNGNVTREVRYATIADNIGAVDKPSIDALVQQLPRTTADRVTTNRYNAAGQLTFSMDGLGDVTERRYDKAGRLTQLIAYATRLPDSADPAGVPKTADDRVTQFAYDAAGRLRFSVDAMGGVTENIYNAAGQVVKAIAYDKRIAEPASDNTGAPDEDTLATAVSAAAWANDPKNRSSFTLYDRLGRAEVSVDADGAVTSRSFDDAGHVTSERRYVNRLPAGAVTLQTTPAYLLDHLVQADSQHDRGETYVYDSVGRRVFTIDSEHHITGARYDGMGRVITTRAYVGTYDWLPATLDQATLDSILNDPESPPAPTTNYYYDQEGRPTGTYDAQGHSESISYDGAGHKMSFYKNGVSWLYHYDGMGNLVQEDAPNALAYVGAIITRMTYDALGQLSSRTEAAGTTVERTTRYEYDALGRQVATHFPQERFYDAAADAVQLAHGWGGDNWLTDPIETESRVTYDVFGDAVANTDVLGNVSYKAYDKLGRVVYDVDAMNGVTRYERDTFGDVTTLTRYDTPVSLPAGTSALHAPDAKQVQGVIALESSKDRAITTEYDAMGRAVKVTQPQVYMYHVTAAGTGDGHTASTETTTVYNAFGEVQQVSVQAFQTIDPPAVTHYYYDTAGRQVATVDVMGFVTEREYDAFGNVTRQTEYARPTASADALSYGPSDYSDDNRVTAYTYDELNRKTSQTLVGVRYSTTDNGLDTVGNLTTRYTYDALGNLTSTVDALGNATYTYYDRLGRIKAVVGPRRNNGAFEAGLLPVTRFYRDALGNVVTQVDYALGASSADENSFYLVDASEGQGVGLDPWYSGSGGSSGDGYGGGYGDGYGGPHRGVVTYSSQDRVTRTDYDSHGNATRVTDAEGQYHYSAYDAAGHLMKSWQTVYGENGIQALFTAFRYDALGRQKEILTPGSGVRLNAAGTAIESINQYLAGSVSTTLTWNAFGELRQRQTGDVVETTDYDQAGRAWRTTSGGVTTVMLYDEYGHLTAQISSAGSVDTGGLGIDLHTAVDSAMAADALAVDRVRRTDYRLDLLGRQLRQILPRRVYGGSIAVERPSVYQTFDRWGNVVTQTDVNDADLITKFTYNVFNQVTRKLQPNASGATVEGGGSPETSIFYDALGRQVAVRDAEGNLNGQTWDGSGELLEEHHADGGVVKHGYNVFGDQVWLRDAEQHLTTYDYDRMGRNTRVTHTDVDIYDAGFQNGAWLEYLLPQPEHQITSVSTYDGAGRKTSQTAGNGLGRITYSYDARGNVVRTTDAVGNSTYAAFDALGHMVAQADANGSLSTWTYNASNQLKNRTDIGGATYTYTYDNANQLVSMGNNRSLVMEDGYYTRGPQNLHYTYDAAGQLVKIVDASSHYIDGNSPGSQAITTYRYNLAGKRVLETLSNDGTAYQDQSIGYDNLGRMVRVDDLIGNLQVDFTYDKFGNTLSTITSNRTTHERIQALFFGYNNMNQVVLADGAVDDNPDNHANLTATQGHLFTYDRNGNRKTDTSVGKQVWSVTRDFDGDNHISTYYESRQGELVHYYDYDGMDRLTNVSVNRFTEVFDGFDENSHMVTHVEVGDRSTAVFLESRLYNAASQQVWAGPGSTMDAEYAAALFENNTDLSGSTSTRSQYDDAGRLISQRVETSTNRDNFWTLYYDAPDAYDGAGNVLSYVQAAGDTTSTIINHVTAVDGYKQWAVYTDSRSNSSGNETEGILVNVYDTNGYLVRVNDNSNGGGDSRSFVNDAYGHVLQKTQQGHVMRQLVVNGNVIGTYGVGVDAVNPKNPDRTPNFSDQTDFDLGNRPISASFPNAAAGPYSVQAGDTLRGIALAVYGDAELWYQIAAANGLRGDQDLRVGQTINIPTQVGSHNNASTFTPYNPGKITGSTSPNLPTPVGNGDDGCGTLGTVIMVAVAIAVTVVTQGAAGGFAGALLGAAAGSVASQAVGIAIGAQDKFSWNAVGDAVLVAGITYGLAPGADAASSGWQAAAARAAVANVATQGIKVAVGSQDHFEWKRVAASAVGAGVGGYLNSTGAFAEYGQYGGAFARAGVAGLATAAAGGGKIEVERIAADAFGNTLGHALGDDINSRNPASEDYRNEMDRQSDAYAGPHEVGLQRWSQDPAFDALTDMLSAPATPYDTSGGFHVASSDNVQMTFVGTEDNQLRRGLADDLKRSIERTHEIQRLVATDRSLNSIDNLAQAYRNSGMTGSTGDPLTFGSSLIPDVRTTGSDLGDDLLGGVRGVAQTTAEGVAGGLRIAGNTVIELGHIASLGYFGDTPIVQRALIEQGSLFNGVWNAVTSPRETTTNAIEAIANNYRQAEALGAQGQRIAAATINASQSSAIASAVLGGVQSIRSVSSMGAAGLRSTGIADWQFVAENVPASSLGRRQTGAIGVSLEKIGGGNLLQRSQITAPSGRVITVVSQDGVIVPVNKVEVYARGGSPNVSQELTELQAFKQQSRKTFDLDPANQVRIDQLKSMQHNFERSQAMAKDLESIGLPNTLQNNDLIMRNLLETGNSVAQTNRVWVPGTLAGPNGSLRVNSTWSILPDGTNYLSTLRFMPIGE